MKTGYRSYLSAGLQMDWGKNLSTLTCLTFAHFDIHLSVKGLCSNHIQRIV